MSDDERLAAERMQEAAKAVTMLVNAVSMVTLMPPDQQTKWLAMYDRALATYESCLDAWTAFHRAEG